MSKSPTPNQKWRKALQKVKQFVKVARPDGKPNINGLRRAKTRFARKEWKHVVSDKFPTIPEVCQANYDGSWRAKSRKLKPPHCRNMQRKYAPNVRLPPIAEDSEVGFEEAPEAKTHHTKHLEAKIHKAKASTAFGGEKRIRAGKAHCQS